MQFSVQQKCSSFEYHRSVPNGHSHEAAHIAFPEMGSRVDDLNIRSDQIAELALIWLI